MSNEIKSEKVYTSDNLLITKCKEDNRRGRIYKDSLVGRYSIYMKTGVYTDGFHKFINNIHHMPEEDIRDLHRQLGVFIKENLSPKPVVKPYDRFELVVDDD